MSLHFLLFPAFFNSFQLQALNEELCQRQELPNLYTVFINISQNYIFLSNNVFNKNLQQYVVKIYVAVFIQLIYFDIA